MDERDIEAALRGDMQIREGDIPKSTLAAAGILWAVLAALGGWTLKIVSDMRVDIGRQADAIVTTNARIDRVEKQTDQNTSDIRDLQRAHK